MRQIEKCEELFDSYDFFIIDQWGVLHDGVKPFPKVLSALDSLSAHGKKIIMLSNSGKRAQPNLARMVEMGFNPAHFTAVVTSGEALYLDLAQMGAGQEKVRALVLSRGGDMSVIEGTNIEPVATPEEADILIISGSDAPQKTMDDYAPILLRAAQQRLPCYCGNPDVIAIIDGQNFMGAGSIAHHYETLGGQVFYYGKPFAPVYQTCFSLFGDHATPARTVAIGDSLEHDIRGGRDAGCATCLVTNGIHKGSIAEKGLPALSEEYEVTPDFTMADFA